MIIGGLGGAAILLLLVFGYYLALPDRAVPAGRTTRPPIEHPARQAMPGTIEASGYIVARRQATISARISGQISKVLVEEGQQVTQGEIIALLDSSQLAAARRQADARLSLARAALTAAAVGRDNAVPMFRRSEQLRSSGWVSGAAYDAAKARYDASRTDAGTAAASVAVAEADLAAAKRNEQDAIVRAPFSGVVTQKNAQPGEIVSPMSAGGFTRTGIATIVDPASLEAEIEVAEALIGRVARNAPARVRLDAYPEWSIPARVVSVIPAASRAKGTVKVRIGLLASDPRILPEMAARVSLDSAPASR